MHNARFVASMLDDERVADLLPPAETLVQSCLDLIRLSVSVLRAAGPTTDPRVRASVLLINSANLLRAHLVDETLKAALHRWRRSIRTDPDK